MSDSQDSANKAALAIRDGDMVLTSAELDRMIERRAREIAREMVSAQEDPSGAITPSQMKEMMLRWTSAVETMAKANRDMVRLMELKSSDRF
jgi:hypothetical protein